MPRLQLRFSKFCSKTSPHLTVTTGMYIITESGCACEMTPFSKSVLYRITLPSLNL